MNSDHSGAGDAHGPGAEVTRPGQDQLGAALSVLGVHAKVRRDGNHGSPRGVDLPLEPTGVRR